MNAKEREARGNRGWENWAAVLPIAAGFVGIMAATPHGIGLSPDSVAYVGGARNILAGQGFSMPPENQPITHLAPLYPGLLAALGLTGRDPVDAARWLSAALFSLNLLLIHLLARRAAPGEARFPAWIAVGVTAFAFASRPMWEVHIMAWTEPLFIACVLTALWLMAKHLEKASRAALLGAGLMVGLAIPTRYAGLAIWAALCLVLLLFQRDSALHKARQVLVFSAVSLTPFLIWGLRNFAVAGTATNRSVSFHPIGADRLHEGLATAASWLMVPDDAGGWTKLGALTALGLALGAGVVLPYGSESRNRLGPVPRKPPQVVGAAVVAAGVYLTFLLVSISTADANTPLDQRILSPLFVLLLVPFAFALQTWASLPKPRRLGSILAILLLVPGGLAHARAAYPLLEESVRQGVGFNSLRWRDSDLVRDLRSLAATGIVYSNSPDAVYFHLGREARRIPSPLSKMTRSPNPQYRQELRAMREDLENGGLLVYFELGGAGVGGSDAILRELDLVPLRVYSNGAVYARR